MPCVEEPQPATSLVRYVVHLNKTGVQDPNGNVGLGHQCTVRENFHLGKKCTGKSFCWNE